MSGIQWTAKQATPHEHLIEELLDSRTGKTEREHAAAKEIERLRELLAEAYAATSVLNTRIADELTDALHPDFGYEWREGGIIHTACAHARKDGIREAIQALKALIATVPEPIVRTKE